jgi:tetratricopeptide (TPR) repeat protein
MEAGYHSEEVSVTESSIGKVYADLFRELVQKITTAFISAGDQLNVLGQHQNALAVANALLAENRPSLGAKLLAIDALLKLGACEEVMSRLVELRTIQDAAFDLAPRIKDALVLGVNLYNNLLGQNDYGRALALVENMSILAPSTISLVEAVSSLALAVGDIDKHKMQQARADELRIQEFRSLIGEADKCYLQRNFQKEIDLRLQIFRNPLDLNRSLAYRIDNIYHILSRMFIKPLDAVAKQLAQELISHVPPVTEEMFLQPLDQLGRHERFLRHSIGSIDLDTVFGEPLEPLEGPILSFASSSGQPLSVDDICEIIRQRDVKVGFFTAGSQLYFETCGPSYISSILNNCDIGALVFVCAEGGWGTIGQIAEILRISDHRVILCTDDSFRDEGGWKVFGSEEAPRIVSNRYACVGLLALEKLLGNFRIPFILSGLDTILQRGVGDLIDEFNDCDIVFNKVEHGHRMGSYLVNSLELVYPTQNAMLLARFLSRYLGQLLEQRYQPFAIDQQVLVMAQQHLIYNRPNARIDFFSEFDINNVMFNQENIEDHRDLFGKFRFVNIFKEGQQEKSLK